jgi:hypothetical protein
LAALSGSFGTNDIGNRCPAILPRIPHESSVERLAVTEDAQFENALAPNSMLLEYRLESVLGMAASG